MSDNHKRCETLRNNVIKEMKKLVSEKPDQYDANKLQDAINAVNNCSDEHIDAFLIMQRELDILQKSIYTLTTAEVQLIKNVMIKHGYTVDTENVDNTEAGRSDYMARWKHSSGKTSLIWLNRMRPLFSDQGEYNLLSINMWFPSANYHTWQDAINALDKEIEKH